MDQIKNYLACVTGCALPGIIATGVMFGAMGLLLTILALVGVATLITIPEIWIIVGAAYGVAIAAILVTCLVACGFYTATNPPPATDGGNAGGDGAVNTITPVDWKLGAVTAILTGWFALFG